MGGGGGHRLLRIMNGSQVHGARRIITGNTKERKTIADHLFPSMYRSPHIVSSVGQLSLTNM